MHSLAVGKIVLRPQACDIFYWIVIDGREINVLYLRVFAKLT
jgi:hypothetical protein